MENLALSTNAVATSVYQTILPPGGHWSLRLRAGSTLKITDTDGSANVGMLFYNPESLLERYNAPDTLKAQHTFKLTRGHCLYSDMGRIFASIIDDSHGWHDTVSGNSHPQHIERWGLRDYQNDSNEFLQNGNDAFLVELTKYGLRAADLAANLNFFSKVAVNAKGGMRLDNSANSAGQSVTLRIEMDTLVIMHNCPHPLSQAKEYPRSPVTIDIGTATPMTEDDFCLNACEENRRGFINNALYRLGLPSNYPPLPMSVLAARGKSL